MPDTVEEILTDPNLAEQPAQTDAPAESPVAPEPETPAVDPLREELERERADRQRLQELLAKTVEAGTRNHNPSPIQTQPPLVEYLKREFDDATSAKLAKVLSQFESDLLGKVVKRDEYQHDRQTLYNVAVSDSERRTLDRLRTGGETDADLNAAQKVVHEWVAQNKPFPSMDEAYDAALMRVQRERRAKGADVTAARAAKQDKQNQADMRGANRPVTNSAISVDAAWAKTASTEDFFNHPDIARLANNTK